MQPKLHQVHINYIMQKSLEKVEISLTDLYTLLGEAFVFTFARSLSSWANSC